MYQQSSTMQDDVPSKYQMGDAALGECQDAALETCPRALQIHTPRNQDLEWSRVMWKWSTGSSGVSMQTQGESQEAPSAGTAGPGDSGSKDIVTILQII